MEEQLGERSSIRWMSLLKNSKFSKIAQTKMWKIKMEKVANLVNFLLKDGWQIAIAQSFTYYASCAFNVSIRIGWVSVHFKFVKYIFEILFNLCEIVKYLICTLWNSIKFVNITFFVNTTSDRFYFYLLAFIINYLVSGPK